MRAVELVRRMVTPSKGRHGRRRPRAMAATHPVSPPPVIPPAGLGDETTAFPRINAHPYPARQEQAR